jgi:hypothetical protein
VREANEAVGMIPFRLVHVVVNQAAAGKTWLIEALAAGEHRNVDARPVHHPHMRGKIGELSIETVIGISFFVYANGRTVLAAPHQLGRCIVMMKIDDHFDFFERECQRVGLARIGNQCCAFDDRAIGHSQCSSDITAL